MKSAHIRSYSDPHFPAFGLNNSKNGHYVRSVRHTLHSPDYFLRLPILAIVNFSIALQLIFKFTLLQIY